LIFDVCEQVLKKKKKKKVKKVHKKKKIKNKKNKKIKVIWVHHVDRAAWPWIFSESEGTEGGQEAEGREKTLRAISSPKSSSSSLLIN